MRATLERAAHADPPLSRREWKALSAVLAATAAWTRLGDHEKLENLAATANLSPKETGRGLNELAGNKPHPKNDGKPRREPIILYKPGQSRSIGGAGIQSFVALITKGGNSAHLKGETKEGNDDRQGGVRGLVKGGNSAHPPEVYRFFTDIKGIKGGNSTPLKGEDPDPETKARILGAMKSQRESLRTPKPKPRRRRRDNDDRTLEEHGKAGRPA